MRRSIAWCGAWMLGVLCAFSTASAEDQRPNILWICGEDMSPHMSCYGETIIATPHVDALAASGVRFTRAFVTAPVCSPSRSAVITGMYQTSIGAHNHRSSRGPVKIHLPDPVQPLPVLFQKAGYHTSLTGRKSRLQSNSPQRRLGKSDYNFEWDEAMYDDHHWSSRRPGQPFFAQVQLAGGKNRQAKVARPVDPANVKLPPYYPDHPVLREDWATYLNSVIQLDDEVGQLLQSLEDEGVAGNTVVFFWTDHGISHVRDKQFLYEGGIWVPLIVRWPGHLTAGTLRDDLVSHIDIAATSLELAGIGVPDYMEGRPLFGAKAVPREYIVAARDRCDETIDRIRCVRDARYKYIRNFYPERSHTQPNAYKDKKVFMGPMRELYAAGRLTPEQARMFEPSRPAEELYDLDADPWELTNLADSSEHTAALELMRSRLDNWIRTTGDRGQVAESLESLASEEPDYYSLPSKDAGQ